MVTARRRSGRFLAFTLVELLVVIAIIAILIGLTSAAVFQYLRKGPEAEVRNEISQLGIALGNFHQKFGTYPPSRIYLADRDTLYNAADPFHQASQQIIAQLFPRIDLKVGVDWNGDGVANAVTLEGDQCLVFFLGGMQTSVGGANGCLGFSTNPKNPTQAGGARIDPSFTFDSSRLVPVNGFFTCVDKFGTNKPYAYFSSGKRRNGYMADCPRLGVVPYAEAIASATAPARYHAPDTFQIVSAGEDGRFGPGGVWTPATAGALTSPGGADDMTNFHSNRMGIP